MKTEPFPRVVAKPARNADKTAAADLTYLTNLTTVLLLHALVFFCRSPQWKAGGGDGNP